MPVFSEQSSVLNTSPALRYVYYGVIALVLSIIHRMFLDLISVAGVTPDLLLILTVWIGVKEGRAVGQFAGFGSGLLFDIISVDVLGTNALAKAIAGFIAGLFYTDDEREDRTGNFRFLLIVFLCALIHNLIYFFFYIRLTEMSFLDFFIKYGVASTLYTTVAAIFPMLYSSRKKRYDDRDF
ncbi:MAG TPA: rod shape-determining protein MreD [Patescibacteria group bacterium]|nr:rod shape-determining protein MreD [Patescibacteria group bacterium]